MKKLKKPTLDVKNTRLFLARTERGVSLLEISICMLIGAIIFIIAMKFYKQRLEYTILHTTAEQISSDLDQLNKFIAINGDNEFSFNKNCVVLIDDQLLRDKILNQKKTDTLSGLKVNAYVKKSSCAASDKTSPKYEVLLAFTSDNDINKADAGELAKNIGYPGGIFDNKLKMFSGWKQTWNVRLDDWGIVKDDYAVAAYRSFYREPLQYDGKSELFNIELQAYNSGMITHQDPVKITSKQDKIKVIWRGAKIHSAVLTITMEDNHDFKKMIEMNILSQQYGGDIFITPSDLLPGTTSGSYKMSIKVTVSGLNGINGGSLNQSINITYD